MAVIYSVNPFIVLKMSLNTEKWQQAANPQENRRIKSVVLLLDTLCLINDYQKNIQFINVISAWSSSCKHNLFYFMSCHCLLY